MRDHDELRVVADGLQIRREPAQVAVVERRLNLVEDVERRAADAVNREQQRKRRERLLTAGHEHHLRDALASRLRADLHAGVLQVVGVGEDELCRAAREQGGEDAAEVVVDRVERADEVVFHARIDDADDLGKAAARAVEVCQLGRQVIVAAAQLLVLLGGIGVDGAHVGDTATQLERILLGGTAVVKLGQRERRLKRHAHILHDGVDGSVDAHLQPALLHTGGRQARVDVIVGVVGGLRPLARGGDLRMQPGRGILRLLGPLLKIVRPATGACGELLEHR